MEGGAVSTHSSIRPHYFRSHRAPFLRTLAHPRAPAQNEPSSNALRALATSRSIRFPKFPQNSPPRRRTPRKTAHLHTQPCGTLAPAQNKATGYITPSLYLCVFAPLRSLSPSAYPRREGAKQTQRRPRFGYSPPLRPLPPPSPRHRLDISTAPSIVLRLAFSPQFAGFSIIY